MHHVQWVPAERRQRTGDRERVTLRAIAGVNLDAIASHAPDPDV